jgi:predicted nucleic acid-binding protein
VTQAIVDAGPLIAAADPSDPEHDRCLATLADAELRLFIPALVVGEVCYFLEKLFGPEIEADFLRSLADSDVRAPIAGDWLRISELVLQYADFPLGAVDASVVALAERLETDTVITLDRRHFSAIKPRHCEFLRLLP